MFNDKKYLGETVNIKPHQISFDSESGQNRNKRASWFNRVEILVYYIKLLYLIY